MSTTNVKIGFIGQGWIGKHYADDFENRGHDVVRYALEEPYAANKDLIKDCDIVLIAVPTPTTEDGFDDSYVTDALTNIGEGKIAVIKSTIPVGTTKRLQAANPKIRVFHSPEFLVEKTAAYDAAHPNRNIIGIPEETEEIRIQARQVMRVLADAPYEHIMDSNDAELVKYAGNCFLFTKVMYINLLYDLVESTGGDWQDVREALIHDPRIGISHTQPVSSSRPGSPSGRGAGGHCFIKDFETFREMYDVHVKNKRGSAVLEAQAYKNLELLLESNKDVDLLEGVYGDLEKFRKPA